PRSGRFGAFVSQLQTGIPSLGVLLMVLCSTLVAWVVVGWMWQMSLYSISITPGFGNVLGLTCLIAFANVIGLIPGGLGVGEASISAILIRWGTAIPLAQAGALILRANSLMIILLGAIHWLAIRGRFAPGAPSTGYFAGAARQPERI